MEKPSIPFRQLIISPSSSSEFEEGRVFSILNKCGIFYCRQGSAELLADEQLCHIGSHDLYVYVTSSVVRIMRRSEDMEGVAVEADVDYVLPIINKVVNAESLLFLRGNPCVSLTPEQSARLEYLFNDIGERTQSDGARGADTSLGRLRAELIKSVGQTLCYEVLHIYFTNKPFHTKPLNRKDAIYQNFMLSLFRHYRKERNVTFYAHLQHITPRHFSSIIKERTGHSALHWIAQMVIAEARQQLESGDLSVKEIADGLNFPSPSFFGKYFKQYVGVAPKEYRKRVR